RCDVVEGLLHLADQIEKASALRREVLSCAKLLPQITHHCCEIEPIAEVIAVTSNDDCSCFVVAVELGEHLRHLAPEIGPHSVTFAGSRKHYFDDPFILVYPERLVFAGHISIL